MKFITRKFFSLLATSTMAMVITAVLQLSNTVIAGNMLGADAIAGINVVMPVFSIAVFSSVLISIGPSVSYSSAMGEYDKSKADGYFGQGVILAVAVGVILFLFAFFGKTLYFHPLALSDEVRYYAQEYYSFYPLIALTYPFFSLLVNMVYTDGDEFVCNLAYGTQIVGNIIGSILFCKLIGIREISLGTLTGTILATLVLLLHFARKASSLHFKWHIRLRDILEVAKFGVTDGVQFLCNACSLYILNRLILLRFGSNMLPILSVVIGVVELSNIFDGIGQALNPLVSIYQSENNNLGIRTIMVTARRTAIVEGLVAMILLLVFANQIPSMFGITDVLLTTLTALAIRIIATTMVVLSLTFLYTSYYLLQEKLLLSIGMTVVSDFIGVLVIGIPLALIFGINGLWVGFAAGPVVSLAFGFAMIFMREGRAAVPLLLSEDSDTHIQSFDITLTQESMMTLRDNVEAFLDEQKTSKSTVYKAMLMIEEICGLIRLKNPDKQVYMECTVMTNKKVTLIFQDSGVIFDVTDADMNISSWSSYVVAAIMERQKHKLNLTTMGYDRNEFCFQKS